MISDKDEMSACSGVIPKTQKQRTVCLYVNSENKAIINNNITCF
jgi:hypothetical protein